MTIYVLSKTKNNIKVIIAVSEDRSFIARYIDTFKDFFDKSADEYSIDTITDNEEAIKIISMHDKKVLLPYNDDMVLTEQEIGYINHSLRNNYSSFKTMLMNLIITSKSLVLTDEELSSVKKTCGLLLDKCHSFSTFTDSMKENDVLSIIKAPMCDPDRYRYIRELDDQYQDKVCFRKDWGYEDYTEI